MSENYQIQEENLPDHHFRTEIPNVIWELGLNPHERDVYFYLKKIAGDNGKCWQSVPTISKTLGICERQIQICMKTLSAEFAVLGCPLIKIISRKKQDGSRDSNLILIVG